MKIHRIKVKNFGSYSEFDLDFSALGLTLIHGKTGSGKSTIMDMVSWCLFGDTAKGVKSDEVRSWFSNDEPTIGQVWVNDIKIGRFRGDKNDLYIEQGADFIRGKDLNETQEFIDKELGCNFDNFVTGSYFHEFSPISSFFTAKAKERRELFENLADLSLPNTLVEKLTEQKKIVKSQMSVLENTLSKESGKLEQLNIQLCNAKNNEVTWSAKQKESIQLLTSKFENFDSDKQAKIDQLNTSSKIFEDNKKSRVNELKFKLENLLLEHERFNGSDICPECGAVNSEHSKLDQEINRTEYLLKDALDSKNTYTDKINIISSQVNPYLEAISVEKNRVNPWNKEIKTTGDYIGILKEDIKKDKNEIEGLKQKLEDYTLLYNLSSELRGELLKNCIDNVNTLTNNYLEKYFDSEIRTKFELEGDSLVVTIHKSGYDCSYKQLSKGQRGLLKLCFNVSIMSAISDTKSIKFNNLFFDEALDGLDGDLKVKAFSLFQELLKNCNTIFIIDHTPEFKNLFDNKFLVTMENEMSTLSEE